MRRLSLFSYFFAFFFFFFIILRTPNMSPRTSGCTRAPGLIPVLQHPFRQLPALTEDKHCAPQYQAMYPRRFWIQILFYFLNDSYMREATAAKFWAVLCLHLTVLLSLFILNICRLDVLYYHIVSLERLTKKTKTLCHNRKFPVWDSNQKTST
jgi:hypothetical protein